MKIVVFRTAEEQARGLRGMRPIPEATLFVFPGIKPGTRFTAEGVLEAFDVDFLDADYTILSTWQLDPGNDVVAAPARCALAVESRSLTGLARADLAEIRRAVERGGA